MTERASDLDRWVEPSYAGAGLANLPAAVLELVGAPTAGLLPAFPLARRRPDLVAGVSAVVVLLLDGLGAQQLEQAVARGTLDTLARLYQAGRADEPDHAFALLTSVFPSSTVPALVTLATGLPPARHGLLGWTLYLPELGGRSETVRWGPSDGEGSYADPAHGSQDPIAFLGLETIHHRLARAGVAAWAVIPAEYVGSPFSRMLYDGATLAGYESLPDLFAVLARLLAERDRGRRTVVQAYWPGVDKVAHDNGPHSRLHAATLADLDRHLGAWLASAPRLGDLLLLVTADHGHVSSWSDEAIIFTHHPELLELLETPPTGERRAAFLHPRPDCRTAVGEYVRARLGDAVLPLAAEEAFARGWFGPGEPSPAARRRAGALLLLPRSAGAQLAYPGATPTGPRLHAGTPGALEPAEMLVPLLAARL